MYNTTPSIDKSSPPREKMTSDEFTLLWGMG